MLTLVFGRQSTPYAKTRPRSARLYISSAVVNHSVNACVASELVSRLQQQLQQLCKEYHADGASDMQQFLQAVGHIIRFH